MDHEASIIHTDNIEGLQLLPLTHSRDVRGTFSKLDLISLSSLADYGETMEVFWTTSNPNVARGMHIVEHASAGAKFVSVIQGALVDIVVDLRESSPSFLHMAQIPLEEQGPTLLVPNGCAHGFVTKSGCLTLYLQDSKYERSRDLGFDFESLPLDLPRDVIRSKRDAQLPLLEEFLRDRNSTLT